MRPVSVVSFSLLYVYICRLNFSQISHRCISIMCALFCRKIIQFFFRSTCVYYIIFCVVVSNMCSVQMQSIKMCIEITFILQKRARRDLYYYTTTSNVISKQRNASIFIPNCLERIIYLHSCILDRIFMHCTCTACNRTKRPNVTVRDTMCG